MSVVNTSARAQSMARIHTAEFGFIIGDKLSSGQWVKEPEVGVGNGRKTC